MSERLVGKVAIVTGAGSGIGRAAALALAREGARVALVGRRSRLLEEVKDEIGGEAVTFPADVANERQVSGLTAAVEKTWGRIDILVNSAGTNVPERALLRMSGESWRQILDINLAGPFLLTRYVLPAMRMQRSGTIINVSSMAAVNASLLSGPAYSASKAALNSFTESINLSERSYGIRACAICPGEVATPILEQRRHPPSEAARATMLQPEDLAQTILLVANLPQRAAVELVLIRPTTLRDVGEDNPEETG
jgi:NAD(P)-dependent dehydrogenase (short-subunit alcohol dehydrogenase family)